LGDVLDVSDNHIRAMNEGGVWTNRMLHGRHDRFRFAVDQLLDLDRLHRRADGDCSSNRTRRGGVAKRAGKFF
jgi:hypothetical protein